MTIAVGCAMWANRDWVGSFLPIETRVGGELAAYSRICTAVEGNTTFYATPPATTIDRWRDSVADDFRFVFKLPREITHDRRLRDVDETVTAFLDTIDPLGESLGPISIQLPASFGPADLDHLLTFTNRLPREFAWAVEVRHRAFHAGGDHERALNDALHQQGIDRIVFDSRAMFAGPCETEEERKAFSEKPQLAVRGVATGTQPVVRFIGQRSIDANRSFWAPWVTRVVKWHADGLRPIVFLHTADNIDAPAHARAFHEDCRAIDSSLDPLPELTGLVSQPSLEL
jgi:uncharacterized protein YecE (DUF72 family)